MANGDRPGRTRVAGTTSSVNWLLVILLILLTGAFWRERNHREAAERLGISPRGDLAEDEKTTISLFKTVAPSVVHIAGVTPGDPARPNVFRIQETGSGIIWDDVGHVVTNYHVVEKVDQLMVLTGDGTRYIARRIGIAPDKDLAVLQLDSPLSNQGAARSPPAKLNLVPVRIGTSADLQVGQKVFAIGNPFGLDQTLTTGVISGLGREIMSGTRRPIQDVIQTDAAINPGNSGGPLLDSAGRVIGVNTMIVGELSAGIGFAVPIDTVRWAAEQMIKHGKVERVGIGIRVWQEWVPAMLRLRGVLIQELTDGGAAEQAGLRITRVYGPNDVALGDLIVAVNRVRVKNSVDLYRAFDQLQPGSEVTVTIIREGQELSLPLRLQVVD